jgi:cytochrome P450
MITVSDKQNLPYCNAVIMESQRMANVIAFNLLRVTSRDMEINGRILKKGSVMIPQISVMMIDPKVTFLF